MKKLIEFFQTVGNLKTTKRKGWERHNVKNPESVADHSFRTATMALVLANKLGVDSGKAVKLALIHDISESLVGDITPFDNISKEEKHRIENEAVKKLCSEVKGAEEILKLWKELEEQKTKESKLVKQIDRLETMLQAKEYEDLDPNINLQEFWDFIKDFDFGPLEEIFEEIKSVKRN